MSQATCNLSRFALLLLICLAARPLFSTEKREVSSGLHQQLVQEWEAGAISAAEGFGCHHVMWQLRGESQEQAVTIYGRSYAAGDCLILQPELGGREYFFGYAGQFEGRITNDTPNHWPGVPLYYVRDTNMPVRTAQ